MLQGELTIFFLFSIAQSESQDQVFLRWTTGETATMHILVVHAMVILLTLGPPQGINVGVGRRRFKRLCFKEKSLCV